MTRCPYCRRVIQPDEMRSDQPADPELGAATPVGGDVFLCWACGRPAMYGDDGGLHRPSDAERAWIAAQPGVQAAQAAIAGLRRRR